MRSAREHEEALEGLAREAAASFPKVRLDPGVFVAHVRARLPEGEEAKGLERLHGPDLFLACACLHGDRAAWRELDRAHLARVPDFVGRIDRSPAFADEIRQRLAEKLLHDDEGGPGKLGLYTGRGPLGAWIRVAAIREAQNAKRGRAAKGGVDADEVALASPDHDPEVQLLKRRYAAEFKEAFQAVLVSLSADERNVLRLHYLDGLTIEEVGKAYRVSRATAARHIADAKAKIIERIQKTLGERLKGKIRGADAPRAESMLAFVRSQLDMSLRRHFE
ncbi:MAG: sigma-70 family RNA polymerase sigma factor [Deltaproteobacteria bacterium]|nr:sigma-70 family RNA polymerase sigma factor [Deltaproteobacteria bacterium]